MSEIEDKVTRVGASECGQRASFNPGKERLSGVNDPSYSENQRPQPAACQIERRFLENDFHSFARELRTGEAPLT
jgi:hypothetical protein